MSPSQTLQELRARQPLVHCLTNGVALETTANLLLALGGRAVMADAVDEVAEVTASAQALLINLGMFSIQKRAAAEKAAEKAQNLGLPWVLDPVGVGATELRRESALRLLRYQPTVIRGNASEIAALAQGGSMIGVDSSKTPEGVTASAQALALDAKSVVAVTGEEDLVTDGTSIYRVGGGHTFFTRMTAAGCALSSLVAATLAVEKDPMRATVHALAFYGLAGQIVGRQATGPASFKMAFVDQIFFLDQVTEGCDDLIRKVV